MIKVNHVSKRGHRELIVMLVHCHRLDFTVVEKVNWLCLIVPWTSRTCAATKTLTLDKSRYIMHCSTQPKPLGISWRTGMWESWVGHQKVSICTQWNTTGTRWQFKSMTWIIPPTMAAQLCVAVLRLVRLRTLVENMPCWLIALLATRGGHTHY